MEGRISDINENLKKVGSSLNKLSETLFYSKGKSKNKKNNDEIENKTNIVNSQNTISSLGRYGHLISKGHESLISIRRSLSFMSKAEQIRASAVDSERFDDLLYEASILEEHISFLSDKIDFLLEINFGLIDLEQNVITRVLSIAALVFLPPTIISSAYGMNFDKMPIVHFEYGFEVALFLILVSAVLPYLYCKKKGIL